MLLIEEIFKDENKNIEFKEILPVDSKKYLKTICGYANSYGGKIIIGVEDNTKKIIGVEKELIHETIDKLTNIISDSITPQIIPNIYYEEVEDKGTIKYLVVCEIYCGSSTPYYIKTLGKEKGTYVRTAGSTRPIDDVLLKELELRGRLKSFDEQIYHMIPLKEAEINKFCYNLTEFAKNNAKSQSEKDATKVLTINQLLSWGAIKEIDGKYYPTNAYMLLSDNNPFEFNMIQCGLFKGNTRKVFIDKKDSSGAIYKQIDEAYQFVLKHINFGFEFNGLYRVESYELPERMIREIICNAVCHRQIMSNSCIQVAVYDNRVEITSPGTLYGGLTISMIKNGRTAIRNKVIANALKYLHFIEQWGLGIISSIEECIERNIRIPEFIEMSEAFRVNLYRPSYTQQDIQQDTQQDALQDSYYNMYNLTNDMKMILRFCVIPRSLNEIMAHINKSDRVNVKYNIIDKLIKMNLLSMTIPEKPTSKNQKYITVNKNL